MKLSRGRCRKSKAAGKKPEGQLPCTTVKDSRIHGRGVFAARNILPNEMVIDWSHCSRSLTEAELATLSSVERKRVSFIDGGYVLFLPPACYVNHSCDPNARGVGRRDVAIRAINKGEEITVDYVKEKVPGLRIECNCGSPKCRKYLCLLDG